MNKLFYIPSLKTILNADAIIKAEFIPAHIEEAHTDEDSGRHIDERKFDARLIITTTEQKLETVDGYDGAFRGCATVSGTIKVKGEEAEKLWGRLKYCASGANTMKSSGVIKA